MQPAARLTDMHVCPMVTGVVPHVGGGLHGNLRGPARQHRPGLA